ncbi:MAG TPA: sigma-70 family RNA polymerase sigma factor [Planctomycetota bacterium]|nr:sigma-70 family RNA polymerase sigma factor [Planctomycetota bacterium]
MSSLEHELTAHSTALRALARVLVGDRDADDLVQDTTLQVLRAPPQEPAGLRGWLTAVLRHRASKHHRAEGRRRTHTGRIVEPEPTTTPPHLLERKETIERLHVALRALPEPYHSTLLARFFEDLTPSEIAAQSQTPLATVKSRLQRGITMLRERLPEGGDRDGWRPALVAAFGLDRAALVGRGLGTASAGVLLMATKAKLLAGTTLVLLAICLFAWTRLGEAPALPTGHGPGAAEATAAAAAAAQGPGAAAPERIHVATGAPPAPIRVRIVDAFDRAGLPFYAVRVVAADQPDAEHLVVSDANGDLSLDGALRGRAASLEAVDDPEHPLTERQVHDVAADGWPAATSVLEVPFQSGPTYTLLFETTPPEGATLAVSLLAGTEPRLDWRGNAVPRRGPLPWLRFDPHWTNPSALGDGPWTLTALDGAGLWVAWGSVQAVHGAQRQPVLMKCDARGAVAVHTTERGRDYAGDFHVSVYHLDDHGEPSGRDTSVQGTHAHARVPFLAPGRYRVYVGRLDDTSHSEDVTVRAGEVHEVAAEFAARDANATLRVVARSQTGRRDFGVVTFCAERPDGSDWRPAKYGPPPQAEPLASKPLEITYEAHFADLPPGEWIVKVEPTRRLPPWQQTEQRARADAGAVEFVCLDEGAPPAVSIAVQVVQASTGAPITYAGVQTYADHEAWMCLTTGADGTVRVGTFLAGQPVQILVRAAGCLPAWIDTTAPGEDNAAPIRVEMSSGWGTMLLVVEPSPGPHGKPMPDVQVLLDGVLAGSTDARGEILLQSSTRPRRIELRAKGYHVGYGGIDPATGAPESQEQYPFFVVMQRDE